MSAPNPNASIPWDQTPDYIRLTERVIPPGGQTTYSQVHPVGHSPTDVTTYVYGQRDVHIGNWPDVLYMLFPPPGWEAFRNTGSPPQKLDANQRPMFERWPRVGRHPRPLLDFPILPDNISSREELWRHDLWRKMDPRISWDDITMRMEVHGRTRDGDVHLQNSLQTTLGRHWHKHYHQISWVGRGRFHYSNTINPTRIRLLNELANANPPIPLTLNTTRGLTPGSINPGHGPNGAVIGWPNIGGGVIRGPRAGWQPPTVGIPAIGGATSALPVTASALPPAAAPATIDTGAEEDISDSERTESVAPKDFRGTDTFGDDSQDATSADEGDDDQIMDLAANSNEGWSSSDTLLQNAPAYSFNFGHSVGSSLGTTPAAPNHNISSAAKPCRNAFTPINRASPAPVPSRFTATSPDSEAPAKRHCSGPGIHNGAKSHRSAATSVTEASTSGGRISFRLLYSTFPVSASQNTQPDPDSLIEPHRQSTGNHDAVAAAQYSTFEEADFFAESGEVPPDGYFY